MAITCPQQHPKLASVVCARLCALRRRIRWYVWWDGLAITIICLGLVFWASLAFDWFFEPAVVVRVFLLAVIGASILGMLFELAGRRTLVRLTNRNMATVLERHFPQLEDILLTAVTLTERAKPPAGCNPEMLARTCDEAAQRMEHIDIRTVFNPIPLRRNLTVALLFSITVILFALLFPTAVSTWAQRSFLLSDQLWPRTTRLVVEGFDDGATKVARGADLELIVKADTSWPVIPKAVQIRFRNSGRKKKVMSREGTVVPGRESFQIYSCIIESILNPLHFDIVGGDARVDNLRIEVVDSPVITEMKLRCQYPGYMNRTTLNVPVSGIMQIPQGTEVTVHAKTNKDMVRIQTEMLISGSANASVIIAKEGNTGNPKHFQHTIPSLKEDCLLLFTLTDTDGIISHEPIRLSLVAVADTPPELTVELDGIGNAVTPNARLPVIGTITDDWGIAEVWFTIAFDDQQPSRQSIVTLSHDATQWKLDTTLEVAPWNLKPGHKLTLGVEATDRYDLGNDLNRGRSDRWVLDIVTPEQLRLALQSRELVLRQRFENILGELKDTRDLLMRFDFTDVAANDSMKVAEGQGKEPGDDSNNSTGRIFSPQKHTLEILQVQRAITSVRKNEHEIHSVAESFEDIFKQLTNNRLDVEGQTHRLAHGIIAPLHTISKSMFPKFEKRLSILEDSLSDKQRTRERLSAAREQAEEILLAMNAVLDQMLELEGFNKAQELLRSIIRSEEELRTRTRSRHQGKLRELLEDSP